MNKKRIDLKLNLPCTQVELFSGSHDRAGQVPVYGESWTAVRYGVPLRRKFLVISRACSVKRRYLAFPNSFHLKHCIF